MLRSRTILIQTTTSCNYRCKYCSTVPHHLNEQSASGVISEQIIRVLFDVLSSAATIGYSSIAIVWHGGEPLLAGKDFFRFVFSLSDNLFQGQKIKVIHQIQSNLGLLDQDWIDIIRSADVSISTSLDLPPEIHDTLRLSRKGIGTFQVTVDKIQKLIDFGISVRVVTVVSSSNVSMADALYDSIKKLGVSFQFMPCHPGRTSQGLTYAPAPADYFIFLRRLFDRWLQDSHPPNITNFDYLCKAILGVQIGLCTFTEDCTKDIIAIDDQGDLWPCCSCIGYNQFRLSNIFKKYGPDFILGIRPTAFAQRATQLPIKCQKCLCLSLCYGGCMCSADEYFGSFWAADPLCDAYRSFFEYARNCIYGYIPNLAK